MEKTFKEDKKIFTLRILLKGNKIINYGRYDGANPVEVDEAKRDAFDIINKGLQIKESVVCFYPVHQILRISFKSLKKERS